MATHPCEARRYLTSTDRSVPSPTICDSPIEYRVTFWIENPETEIYVASDGSEHIIPKDNANGGQVRAGIAYFCAEHMIEVVRTVDATDTADTRSPLTGVDIKPYVPRTEERQASLTKAAMHAQEAQAARERTIANLARAAAERELAGR